MTPETTAQEVHDFRQSRVRGSDLRPPTHPGTVQKLSSEPGSKSQGETEGELVRQSWR